MHKTGVPRVNECTQPSSFFFQLPFPEMTNSNRTGKAQASVHVFILDDYHPKAVRYRKCIPVTADVGPVIGGQFKG